MVHYKLLQPEHHCKFDQLVPDNHSLHCLWAAVQCKWAVKGRNCSLQQGLLEHKQVVVEAQADHIQEQAGHFAEDTQDQKLEHLVDDYIHRQQWQIHMQDKFVALAHWMHRDIAADEAY